MSHAERKQSNADAPSVDVDIQDHGEGSTKALQKGIMEVKPNMDATLALPFSGDSNLIMPPGEHPYDPVKKDLDPIGFALYRVQTFLVWIDEHRATFEKIRFADVEGAERELSYLRDSTLQGMIHLQRLSELLLSGFAVDPNKRLPESLSRGWFSSCVREFTEAQAASQNGSSNKE